jgi:predicted small secreted protein
MKFVIKLALVAVTISFAACSTVAGVGKDIQGAADWTHNKMTGKDSK